MRKTIHNWDAWLATATLPLTNERGTLLSFLVHGVFQSQEEAFSGLLDPQQSFTVDMLREFIEHFACAGYQFVSPQQMAAGLSGDGKYVLLTFDDGYYTNIRVVPVLEEFNIPAVFFISSDHVKLGKAFWWDVVYREYKKRGRTAKEIHRASARYKLFRTSEVEFDLREHFGESALSPMGDLDRPFTTGELSELAQHRLVSFGNHTKDHAILTNYSAAEVKEQIAGAQDAIGEITSKTPAIIAYPNGNHSKEILSIARTVGLQFGLVTRAGHNHAPQECGADSALTLKRFTLWGDRPVEGQCRTSRSSLSLYRVLDGLRKERGLSAQGPSFTRKGKSVASSAGSQQV